MRTTLTCLFLLLGILFVGLGCESSNENESEISHNEMLEKLGISTALGQRKDPNEVDLSDTYNPIGPAVGVLFKQCEIYAAGVKVDDNNNALFEDRSDGEQSFPVLYQEPDDGWATGLPKRSIAADVDGDGFDEIVIAVFYINNDEIALRVVDRNDEADPREVIRINSAGTLANELDGTAGGTNDYEDAFFRQDLAAGDFDGDGRAELILIEAGHVFVFDDLDHSFAPIKDFSVYNLNDDTDTYVRVAVADFDVDGRDEFVITNGEDDEQILAEYSIYDDLVTDPAMTTPLVNRGKISTTTQSGTIQLRAAGVTTGDFDGDGLIEVAFAGMRMENEGLATLILDTSMRDNSQPYFELLATSGGDANENGYLIPPIASGDIDGDGDDELVVWEDIYQIENGMLSTETWGNEALSGLDGRDSLPGLDVLKVGDVTGDMKADIVYVTQDDKNIRIIFMSPEGDGSLTYQDISVGSEPTRPTLCLPNVDNDSAVLEYLEHELLFTDPVVVAVLASPPYWSRINGNGTGSTSFGSIEGHATEASQSHGFSVGFSFGTEFTAPFGLGKAEVKTQVEQHFNWGVATTHQITETWGYSTTLGEDKVVFTAIPFDVYYYKVLSSPEPEQIGSTVSINVPRPPGKYHQEVRFYNANNGDGYDVGKEILLHTLGDPFTYDNESERDQLQTDSDGKGLFSQHFLEVGVGGGSSSISLEELTGETSTYDYDLSVTVEAEIGAGGITAGVSAGYEYGYSYSTSVNQGTYIKGEVPDIPTSEYTGDLQFHWGLMAYPVQESGQKYTLVTYWVDN